MLQSLCQQSDKGKEKGCYLIPYRLAEQSVCIFLNLYYLTIGPTLNNTVVYDNNKSNRKLSAFFSLQKPGWCKKVTSSPVLIFFYVHTCALTPSIYIWFKNIFYFLCLCSCTKCTTSVVHCFFLCLNILQSTYPL